MDLVTQHCVPCEGGAPALTREEVLLLCRNVPGWAPSGEGTRICRDYTFPDFARALAFMNEVGALAEVEGHHPDLHLTNYKHVRIECMTHAIGGLSRNDFILAAKIDTLGSVQSTGGVRTEKDRAQKSTAA